MSSISFYDPFTSGAYVYQTLNMMVKCQTLQGAKGMIDLLPEETGGKIWEYFEAQGIRANSPVARLQQEVDDFVQANFFKLSIKAKELIVAHQPIPSFWQRFRQRQGLTHERQCFSLLDLFAKVERKFAPLNQWVQKGAEYENRDVVRKGILDFLLDPKKAGLQLLFLRSLPPMLFEGESSQRLRWLEIEHCSLPFFPLPILDLTSLKALSLRNSLKSTPATLPDEMARLDNLTSLNLGSCNLQAFPQVILSLTKLTTLILFANQLTTVPSGIGKLSNLLHLDLDENRLTSVPPEVSHLTNLQTLKLALNCITHVSPEMGKLSQLRSLFLSSNQLTSVPAELGNLKNLQYLALSNNPNLKTLPSEVAAHPALRR